MGVKLTGSAPVSGLMTSPSRGQLDGFEGSLPEAAFRRGGSKAAQQLAICAGSGKLDEHGRIMAEGDGGAKGAFHAVSNQVAVAAVAQGRPALRIASFSLKWATLPSAKPSSGLPL